MEAVSVECQVNCLIDVGSMSFVGATDTRLPK